LFDWGIISVEPVHPVLGDTGWGSGLLKGNKRLERVAKQVKTYDLDWHFEGWTASRELYDALRLGILELGPNVIVRFTKSYISFIDEALGRSFAEIVPQKKGLKVYLRPTVNELPPSVLKVVDCKEKGHWTNGNSSFDLSRKEDIPHAMSLIKVAWDMVKSGKL